MKIIEAESDKAFAQMLTHIQKDSAAWMCIHINLAALNNDLLNTEGLTKNALEGIRTASGNLAQKFRVLGLDKFKGETFIFEDGDIVVLFERPDFPFEEIVTALSKEFLSQELGTIFNYFPMADKLTTLIMLAKEKKERVTEFKQKQYALEAAEHIFKSTEPNRDLTLMILEKRRLRTEFIILVIEDDIVARVLITSSLGSKYKVVQAKNAKTGVAAYITHAPNLVLLDIHLPDFDGHDTLAKLKLLDPPAYIVMLSADSVVDNVLSTRSQGAAGFIKKPFSKEKIIDYINKCPIKSSTATVLGWDKITER